MAVRIAYGPQFSVNRRIILGNANFSQEANSAVKSYLSENEKKRMEMDTAIKRTRYISRSIEDSFERNRILDIIDGCDIDTLKEAIKLYDRFGIKQFRGYLHSIV